MLSCTFEQAIPVEVGGNRACSRNEVLAPRRTLDVQIVHELLGHGLTHYFHADERTAAAEKADQIAAVGVTNLYLNSKGLPLSCDPGMPWPPR